MLVQSSNKRKQAACADNFAIPQVPFTQFEGGQPGSRDQVHAQFRTLHCGEPAASLSTGNNSVTQQFNGYRMAPGVPSISGCISGTRRSSDIRMPHSKVFWMRPGSRAACRPREFHVVKTLAFRVHSFRKFDSAPREWLGHFHALPFPQQFPCFRVAAT